MPRQGGERGGEVLKATILPTCRLQYIEEEMEKRRKEEARERRREQGQEEVGGYEAHPSMKEKVKEEGERDNGITVPDGPIEDEGSIALSSAMLTSVTEVDLGME